MYCSRGDMGAGSEASAATIGGALFFEHVLGYVPCSLCYLGRQPHYFAIGAALIAGILSREANIGIGVLFFLGLCAAAYLTGAGISAYHAGVEYHWWAGPESCAGGNLVSNSLEDLQSALSGGATPQRAYAKLSRAKLSRAKLSRVKRYSTRPIGGGGA